MSRSFLYLKMSFSRRISVPNSKPFNRPTVHTAGILQSPPDPSIFHERGQPLSVTALSGQSAKLSAHLGNSQATGAVVVVHGRDNTVDCRSFGNQNPNRFYLRTNNATKWQINQTTVNSNVHFTVDAIMYMYVNNLTGLHDSRYTMYASVEWRG